MLIFAPVSTKILKLYMKTKEIQLLECLAQMKEIVGGQKLGLPEKFVKALIEGF